MSDDQKPVALWRYIVPNAVTCFSLLIGLTVVFRAMEGRFWEAAWLIILCVLLDKLDGTAARALNASSKFGMQLDSLADLVTFGVAPGFTVFMLMSANPEGAFDMWATKTAGLAMRAMIGVFVLGACLRLAKFNVLSEHEEEGKPKVFWGMPTTYAGGMIGLLIVLGLSHEWNGLLRMLPLAAVFGGLMMVSNLPLPKLTPKQHKVQQAFLILNVIVGYTCGILRIYPELLFVQTAGYGVWGFVWGFFNRADLVPPHRQQDTAPAS